MKTTYVPVACLTFVAAAILVACGSGSSRYGGALPLVGVRSAPRPMSSEFPTGNGSRYDYVDAQWGSITAPNSAATPYPIPTSTDPSVTTVETSAIFGSMKNLIEFKSGGPYQGGSSHGNSFYTWVADGKKEAFSEVAATSDFKTGAGGPYALALSTRTTYSQPYVELMQPFSAGATWSQATAYVTDSVETTASSGVTMRRVGKSTSNSDGSYVSAYRSTSSGHVTFGKTIVDSDGSASVALWQPGQPTTKLVIGVPVKQHGSYVIPITTYPGKHQSTIADWYPGRAMPPSPLVTASATDKGSVAIPGACNVPKSIATTAELVASAQQGLDPTSSEFAYTQLSYYAPGVGLVCETWKQIYELYHVTGLGAINQGTYTFEGTESLTKYALAAAMRAVGMRGALQAAADAIQANSARRRLMWRFWSGRVQTPSG